MAISRGWIIDHRFNIPVTLSEDVTEGQIGKLTAEGAASVCTSGDQPAGVFFRTVDISEDGTAGELMTRGIARCLCGGTIVMNTPVKADDAGAVTPCTAEGDIIIGYPLNAEDTAGAYVSIDLAALGATYHA
jgi:hypothetical protein